MWAKIAAATIAVAATLDVVIGFSELKTLRWF
jgi:hypothetical protein